MWHELIRLNSTGEAGGSAECRLPRDSFWFDGHFPDNPILPGVAQLAMAFDLIKACVSETVLRVAEIRRVRFKQIIDPGDSVEVKIIRRKGQAEWYDFQILKNNELACSGSMRMKVESDLGA